MEKLHLSLYFGNILIKVTQLDVVVFDGLEAYNSWDILCQNNAVGNLVTVIAHCNLTRNLHIVYLRILNVHNLCKRVHRTALLYTKAELKPQYY